MRKNALISIMQTKKKGNNWTAYYDPDTNRYFAEIMYTSREDREEYDYEITKEIYDRLIPLLKKVVRKVLGAFGWSHDMQKKTREHERILL